MPYVPKVWADDPAGATPIVAAELNRIETGVADVTASAGATAADVAAIADRVLALEQGLATTNANFNALFMGVQELAARVTALENAAGGVA